MRRVSDSRQDQQDALARKLRSEAEIAGHRLPLLPNLPYFAPLSRIRFRSENEVIRRAAAVTCISHRAQLAFLGDLDEFMKQEDVFVCLTPEEKRYYFSPVDREAPVNAVHTWRIESCHALYWALGHLVRLSYPDAATDPKTLYHLFFAPGLRGFRAASRLRTANEVLDAADLYFRLFALAQHRMRPDGTLPGQLSYPIVRERYVALCWLVGKGEWDELQKNTPLW